MCADAVSLKTPSRRDSRFWRAIANSVGSVSGLIAPYLLGVVKTVTESTNSGVLVLAVCLVLGSLLVFTVPAKLVNRK